MNKERKRESHFEDMYSNFKGTISRENESLQFEGSFTRIMVTDKTIKQFRMIDTDNIKGDGIVYYKDGAKEFEGEFYNDQYSGKGTYHYKDGTKYVGLFKNNKFDGLGTKFNPNGTKIHEGLWKEGEFVEEKAVPQPKEE